MKIFPVSDIVHSAGLWSQPSVALTEFFGSVSPQPCTETFSVAPENVRYPVTALPNSTASVSADLGWLSLILDIWGGLSLWLLFVKIFSLYLKESAEFYSSRTDEGDKEKFQISGSWFFCLTFLHERLILLIVFSKMKYSECIRSTVNRGFSKDLLGLL